MEEVEEVELQEPQEEEEEVEVEEHFLEEGAVLEVHLGVGEGLPPSKKVTYDTIIMKFPKNANSYVYLSNKY